MLLRARIFLSHSEFLSLIIILLSITSINCLQANDSLGIPRDLRVSVFEDVTNYVNYGNYSLLKFNLSWEPPGLPFRPMSYSILINTLPNGDTNEGSVVCPPDENIFRHIQAGKLNIILPDNEVVPTDFSELTVRPACTYEIQIIANPRNHALSNSAKMNFTVPKCVGESCHCGDAYESLPIPQVQGELLDSGEITIKWHVTSNNSGIEYYTLSYAIPLLISNNGLPVYNTTRIAQLPSNITCYTWTTDWNIPMSAQFGSRILVSAEDTHGCLGKPSSFLIKYQVKQEQQPTGVATHLLIYISIVILCLMIFGGIIVIWKSNKYKLILSTNQTTVPSIKKISNRVQWANSILKKHNGLYIVNENNEITDENHWEKFEIPYERLKICEKLGEGQFGKVYLGYLDNDYPVAIKLTNSLDKSNEFEARSQLLDEIDTMKRVGSHSHLVKLVGCCTRSENPICVVLEYVEGGDLLCYLHKLRDKFIEESVISNDSLKLSGITVNSTKLKGRTYINIQNNGSFYSTRGKIDSGRFCHFALDIARGMEHLEKNGIVHRDLAARNILITSNMTLKISDFGLSRDSIYVLGNNGVGERRLPARWMAPEALTNRIFTSKSDIWSYGVVLWEIETLGAFPYTEIQDDELLHQIVNVGTRLQLPDDNCTVLYDTIRECWSIIPADRPSFADIARRLATPSQFLNFISTSNPCYALVHPTSSSYTFLSS